jgi:hypothetical protein
MAVRYRVALSVGVASLLLACAPQVWSAGTVVTDGKPRVQLCFGLGGSNVSRPAQDLFISVHPRVGGRLGLMLVPPQAERVAFDTGLVLDRRAVATRRNWGVSSPPAGRGHDYHVVTFTSLVLPIRLRLGGFGTTLRPYVAVGPELSVTLVAREDDRNVAEWADRLSWNLFSAIGLERAVGGRAAYLELGSSLGLNGLGRDIGGPHGPGSGLGDARSRMIFFAAGVGL